MSRHKSISEVGEALVNEAEARPEGTLPLSTRLFPYVLVASRKMSLREMSAWLAKEHGVEISAMALSRALRSSELHLRRLANFIRPMAEYVGAVFRVDPIGMLYSGPDREPTELDNIGFDGPSCDDAEFPVWRTYEQLSELWRSIPHEVQLQLESYLRFGDDDDETIEILEGLEGDDD